MSRKLGFILLALLSLTLIAPAALADGNPDKGRGDGPVIYVESQGLYYDSIVTATFKNPHGPFQELYEGPNGLTTMWGPGDPEYKGGRWVVNGMYFECPLLGPGRTTP